MSQASDDDDEEDDEHDGAEVIGIDESVVPKMRRWFSNCLASSKSLLYEDDVLQIGVQHQYKGHQGRVMLFVGNKAKHSLDDFSMEVPGDASGINVNTIGDTVSQIATKNRQQQFAVNMSAPFASPPELKSHSASSDETIPTDSASRSL